MDAPDLNAITDVDVLRALVLDQLDAIAQRDALIAQHDAAITQRDHTIAFKDAKIAEFA